MNDNILLMLFFLCFKMVLVSGNPDSDHCYKIKPAAMIGIIIGDVGLTVLIAIGVYHCATRRWKRREEADKVYMNVRANSKA
ncbi:hypothetical protein GJAV_G00004940 [Gymnothorax javanicus]|nr:hypothetical protein GJAV_G00004940 [Gymnothorax javanicus]